MKNMKNFRKAFTMIELVFVIVVIGILSSIAVPKLAASRDDAKLYADLASLKQIKSNFISRYQAEGKPSAVEYLVPSNSCFRYEYQKDGDLWVKFKDDSSCGDAGYRSDIWSKVVKMGLLVKHNGSVATKGWNKVYQAGRRMKL